MKRICALWMEGLNYKDITVKADVKALDVDKVIVSIIFFQNSICRQVRPLVNYMKVKYGVENTYLDSFHELMSAGIIEESQVYLSHHGLRNRICLHAIIDYVKATGECINEFEQFSPFVKGRVDDIRAFLIGAGYPEIVFEKIEEWAQKK